MRNPGAAMFVGRLALGPAALAGFFLPWADGRGVLAGARFSGYELLHSATFLQSAGIDGSTTALAAVARAVLVVFAVTAVCHTLLAIMVPNGLGPRVTGWLLVALTATVVGVAIWQAGMPLFGLWLAAAGAGGFALSEALAHPRKRPKRALLRPADPTTRTANVSERR